MTENKPCYHLTPPPDELPPPPAEIVLDTHVFREVPVLPTLEERFKSQGEQNHTFVVSTGTDTYAEFNVWDFAFFKREWESNKSRTAALENLLKESVENGENIDLLREIADIFNIEMRMEYEFTVQVEFTGTFMLPAGMDPNDVLSDISWSGESSWPSDVENFEVIDYNIVHSDLSEV